MKSKNNFHRLIAFFAIVSFSQILGAQTKVIKTDALKINNYGIQYFLPKTILQIDIDYTQTTQKAGIYAKYASQYLGIDNQSVIMEDGTFYTLNKVDVSEIGIPNKEESYLIEFKAKTTAPFVYLTEDNLICSINAEYTPEQISEKPQTTPNSYTLDIKPQSIFTEEYLRAGSVSKMAEVAAKQIYKIRESRSDILTGEADNLPRDGEAMKVVLANLDAQENGWMELFTGVSETTTKTTTIHIEPSENLSKKVLFRFSKHLGIVDDDDLSGSPIYINLNDLDILEEIKEDPKRKAKEPQSIVYNIPGKASVEIFYGVNKIYEEEHFVTQFGQKQILATSLFEDKKSPVQIHFYPHTGGIRQIIQE